MKASLTNPLKQCVTRQVTIDWSRSDNAVSGPGPKLFASNCSDCTKTCTTHPLATILSSDDDIVVTINWSSLRTCANFVSLTKHRKGSKITSFVFWRNGQWGTYQKTKTNYRCQYLLTHTLMVLSMLIIYSVKKNTPNSYEALLETLRPNETRPNQTRTHQTDSSKTHLSIHSHHTPPLTDVCAIFESFCTLPWLLVLWRSS